ncbi:MAG: hypothetical protein V1872_12625 [bacterium]
MYIRRLLPTGEKKERIVFINFIAIISFLFMLRLTYAQTTIQPFINTFVPNVINQNTTTGIFSGNGVNTGYDVFLDPNVTESVTFGVDNWKVGEPPPEPPPSSEPLVLDLSGESIGTAESIELLTQCLYGLEFSSTLWGEFAIDGNKDEAGDYIKRKVLFPSGDKEPARHTAILCCFKEHRGNPGEKEYNATPDKKVNRLLKIDNRSQVNYQELTYEDVWGSFMAPEGFCQLKRYDQNGDGIINAKDPIFKRLFLWKDNGNGLFEPATERMEVSLDEDDNQYTGYKSIKANEDAKITSFDVTFNPSENDCHYGLIPSKVETITGYTNKDSVGNSILAVGSYSRNLCLTPVDFSIMGTTTDNSTSALDTTMFIEENVPLIFEDNTYKISNNEEEEPKVTITGSIRPTGKSVTLDDPNSNLKKFTITDAYITRLYDLSVSNKKTTDNEKEATRIKGKFEGYIMIEMQNSPLIDYSFNFKTIEDNKEVEYPIDVYVSKIANTNKIKEEEEEGLCKIVIDIKGIILDSKVSESSTGIISADLHYQIDKFGGVDIRYPMWDIAFKQEEELINLQDGGTYVSSEEGVQSSQNLLNGKIIEVDKENNTATINIGAEDGVTEGMVFIVSPKSTESRITNK